MYLLSFFLCNASFLPLALRIVSFIARGLLPSLLSLLLPLLFFRSVPHREFHVSSFFLSLLLPLLFLLSALQVSSHPLLSFSAAASLLSLPIAIFIATVCFLFFFFISS